MTALSCFGIGVAFALAVGLLLFAGVTIGCLIPPRIRRRRRGPRDPDSLTPPPSKE